MKSKLNNEYSFSLLGKNPNNIPKNPEEAKIEVFPNRNSNREYTIELNYPEFSSMCPVTGQPDTANVFISYTPKELCIETKSLKFYLVSFRYIHAFNEEVINKILDDLVEASHPKKMSVSGTFSSRGGIKLKVDTYFP